MAGMGKRMRPHTLTVPKPLIKIAGKPIVQRLAEEITKVIDSKVDEIAFIIGDFGEEVETSLLNIAQNLGSNGKIYYQNEALGTAHAVYCAADSLNEKVIIAFADTLFKANFRLNEETDSVIWTKKVENPEAFGVVKKNNSNIITDFIEKPKKFVSDEAIIGIYYFNSGETLRNELKFLIDNNIRGNNEFQLTDALERLKENGLIFKTETVNEWLDCGNKDATVYTNQRILHHLENYIGTKAEINNSVIIEPCYIGEGVKLSDSVIGPYVSIDKNSVIKNSVIKNSMIQENAYIIRKVIENSMIGNNIEIIGKSEDLSIGDYNICK